MVHGHYFHFIDEPELNDNHTISLSDKTVFVTHSTDTSLIKNYPIQRPWVPLSGQEGRYFSKYPFEEADRNFSWGLEIKEVLTLIWEPKISCIYYFRGKGYSPERLRFWIYHTFFPLLLELSGSSHFLHVGAVESKGKVLLFSALSFGGKSTLTDYFIKQGATLISDDALGIEENDHNYYAIPAYPYHRPYREPETLGYRVEKFAKEAKVVDAVFLLKKADTHAKVTIEEVKGIEKFTAFHNAVFIEFPFRKKERFDFFGKMSQHILVYTLTIPWNIERLHEVYEHISQHSKLQNTQTGI